MIFLKDETVKEEKKQRNKVWLMLGFVIHMFTENSCKQKQIFWRKKKNTGFIVLRFSKIEMKNEKLLAESWCQADGHESDMNCEIIFKGCRWTNFTIHGKQLQHFERWGKKLTIRRKVEYQTAYKSYNFWNLSGFLPI